MPQPIEHLLAARVTEQRGEPRFVLLGKRLDLRQRLFALGGEVQRMRTGVIARGAPRHPFAPLELVQHARKPCTLDPERFSISEAAAETINRAKAQGRRIVSVGTTTTRALEAAARAGRGVITPQSGWTDLFIYPGFTFRIVSALLTNFHLPQSSLLMLVAAFGGRDVVLAAYREAVAREYRFYSYGDAMLIL